jgi:DNA-binding IclR family transcriptional regulator
MAFFGYSQTALKVLPGKEDFHRTLEALAERFGDMAQMGLLINCELLLAEYVLGPNRAGLPQPGLGGYLPAYAFAMGKALLAYEPWEKVHECLERRGLIAYTPNTITRLDQLKTELEQVRQQGYAISQSEYSREWSAVAAPVFNRSGAPIASINACVTAPRFPMLTNELIAAVLSAAHSLSKILGYQPPPAVPPISATPSNQPLQMTA